MEKANLWQFTSGDWEALALREAAALTAAAVTPLSRAAACLAHTPALLYNTGAHWVLLAAPDTGVWVNASPLSEGLRVLADRDAIRIPGAPPLFFATDQSVERIPFPDDQPLPCPRCRDPIQLGDMAVRCPGCGIWHHQHPERECWSYGSSCCNCNQPSAAAAVGQSWSPEVL